MSKQDICKAFDDWAPELLNLVQEADANSVTRSVYMLPVSYRCELGAGTTLLGDATHLMTLLTGECVDLALQLSDNSSQTWQYDHRGPRNPPTVL